jgi:hypothetical protein
MNCYLFCIIEIILGSNVKTWVKLGISGISTLFTLTVIVLIFYFFIDEILIGVFTTIPCKGNPFPSIN